MEFNIWVTNWVLAISSTNSTRAAASLTVSPVAMTPWFFKMIASSVFRASLAASASSLLPGLKFLASRLEVFNIL